MLHPVIIFFSTHPDSGIKLCRRLNSLLPFIKPPTGLLAAVGVKKTKNFLLI